MRRKTFNKNHYKESHDGAVKAIVPWLLKQNPNYIIDCKENYLADIKIKDPDKKAENCGSFVKIVLSNNGIETTKSNWMGDIYNSLNETRGGEQELHIYDFDETIARVETPIPYTVESPEGKTIEKGETTSIEFEET